jgi:hypothetical protein
MATTNTVAETRTNIMMERTAMLVKKEPAQCELTPARVKTALISACAVFKKPVFLRISTTNMVEPKPKKERTATERNLPTSAKRRS